MLEQPKDHPPVTSARIGTCMTCGAKRVLVTSPPLPRHVDMKACDTQRAMNVAARTVKIMVLEKMQIALRPRVPAYATHAEIDAAFGKGSLGR